MKTIIIPCVGMGNVSQWAVNTMIENSSNKNKIPLDGKYLYPFINEKGDTPLCKWCNVKKDIDVIQLLSPIIPGYESLFIKQIVKEIIEGEYEKIIVMDSLDRGIYDEGLRIWRKNSIGELNINNNSNDETTIPLEDTSLFMRLLVNTLSEQLGEEEFKIAMEWIAVSVYDGINIEAVNTLLKKVNADCTMTLNDKDSNKDSKDSYIGEVYV